MKVGFSLEICIVLKFCIIRGTIRLSHGDLAWIDAPESALCILLILKPLFER